MKSEVEKDQLIELDLTPGGEEPDPNEEPPSVEAGAQARTVFYEKRISQINDSLFLGSISCAMKRDWLKKRGITHIVNCVSMILPNQPWPDDFVYKNYFLLDGVREDIGCVAFDAVQFIDKAVSSGGKVYVHCQHVSLFQSKKINHIEHKKIYIKY